MKRVVLLTLKPFTHFICANSNCGQRPQNHLQSSLQLWRVKIDHSVYQSIAKTAALLRENVWFRSMQILVDDTVKSCMLCQIATPIATREPLHMCYPRNHGLKSVPTLDNVRMASIFLLLLTSILDTRYIVNFHTRFTVCTNCHTQIKQNIHRF